MKLAETYSHLNGLEFLIVHKPGLWKEIQDVVTAVGIPPHVPVCLGHSLLGIALTRLAGLHCHVSSRQHGLQCSRFPLSRQPQRAEDAFYTMTATFNHALQRL
jgi:hypothetical protein